MKKLVSKLSSISVVTALAVAGMVLSAKAQLTGTYTQTFDDGGNTAPFSGSGSVAGWEYWYGFYGNVLMTNDTTMDVGGSSTSGSLIVSLPFTASGNQQTWFGSFDDNYGYDFTETANGLNYTNITLDIKVVPGTPPDSSGGFGTLYAGFYQTGTFPTGQEIPGAATNGWVPMSWPIDKQLTGISSVAAFLFDYNSYGGYPKTNITFWLDNVSLNYSGTPPPPPVVSISKAIPGLNVFDSSPGQYDRESIISTATSGYSWVGHTGPVTYSFTITNFPANATSLAAQMFLIAGNGAIPSYETAPDYNETNVVIFAVQGNATNADGAVEYKVGEPNGNAMIYGNAPYTNAPGSGSANFGSGNLGGITNVGVLGTWSLTFNQDTNLTITDPSGGTITYTMTEADAQAFADANSFVVMLGSQPNALTAIGDEVVYSKVSVSGATLSLNDNFLADSTLNTNIWSVLASAPTGVLVVPTTTAYLLDWTVPDAGFSAQVGTNLSNPASYSALPFSPVGQIGSVKTTLIPQSSLTSSQGYYRLINRPFTQLQVLLPGETNAPGTALGYTGSPTPISLAAQGVTPTTITVNACDSQWNIVNETDSITISTTDGGAFTSNASVSMVNGTATFSGSNGILFSDDGSWTVSATDLSAATIPVGTSAPVTVGP
jgi:hypothetical protein